LKLHFGLTKELSSYEAAEKALFKIYSVQINDDLVRKVIDFIGNIIFSKYTQKA
jgi:hypothetical protein